MRLVTIRLDGGTRAGRLDGDEVTVLSQPDVAAVLRLGATWRDWARAADGPRLALSEVDLAPLVPQPGKIICLGLNYRAHVEEMGREMPSHPTVFAKFAEALVGARDPIILPRVSDQVDWEVELAFVIGSPVRHVSEADAAAAIAGYTIFNDVSVRDWQNRTLQFLQGKTFESSTPVGPALVTADEVDGAVDLEVSCSVDGKLMQRGRTSDLVFKPAAIVSYLSDVVTLKPGDIIATGTPAGVGHGRKPPVYLRPGQVVTTRIEGLGEMVNPCVAEGATSSG